MIAKYTTDEVARKADKAFTLDLYELETFVGLHSTVCSQTLWKKFHLVFWKRKYGMPIFFEAMKRDTKMATGRVGSILDIAAINSRVVFMKSMVSHMRRCNFLLQLESKVSNNTKPKVFRYPCSLNKFNIKVKKM